MQVPVKAPRLIIGIGIQQSSMDIRPSADPRKRVQSERPHPPHLLAGPKEVLQRLLWRGSHLGTAHHGTTRKVYKASTDSIMHTRGAVLVVVPVPRIRRSGDLPV